MVMLATLLVPLLMLGLLYCAWRALRMFVIWRPAAAAELFNDYGEGAQAADRWRHGVLSVLNTWEDENGARTITSRVAFEDEEGQRHRVDLRRSVSRGRAPDGAFLLWYDPADPCRVTLYGPGSWLAGAVLLAGTMVGLVAMVGQLQS